jgi:beta-glucosidase
MISSGEINSTPVHANKHLITDILKNELGFEVVVTDWKDVYTYTQA